MMSSNSTLPVSEIFWKMRDRNSVMSVRVLLV
jgi:hypothetical protein